ncbi:hypothetical protein [Ligilactobacillus equi]|uniref:Uncharacterized protein n=1 Tax=Ligilactobacillus equi DPC 6820 TaxID=1392007 RepID=V7HUA1_9LACO|nr:hypothetical protein [Ligilactobacillus equi]ETA73477.1 hypothetical protein LEQ_1849 [Ligilactobacillus equi DPC 6820]
MVKVIIGEILQITALFIVVGLAGSSDLGRPVWWPGIPLAIVVGIVGLALDQDDEEAQR